MKKIDLSLKNVMFLLLLSGLNVSAGVSSGQHSEGDLNPVRDCGTITSAIALAPVPRKPVPTKAKILGKIWEHEGGDITCAHFTPDGKRCVFGTRNCLVVDIETKKEICRFTRHKTVLTSLAISPDGRTAITGGTQRLDKPPFQTLYLWDLRTGKLIRPLGKTYDHIAEVEFSPDGKLALSVTRRRDLIIWDVATGKQLQRWERRATPIRGIHGEGWMKTARFTPDGRSVICAHAAFSLEILISSVTTGKITRRIKIADKLPYKYVHHLAVLNDGKTIHARCESDLLVWDLKTGKQVASYVAPWHANVDVRTPDGKWAYTTQSTNQIDLVHVPTRTERKLLPPFCPDLGRLFLSPDGKRMLAVRKKTILLLELPPLPKEPKPTKKRS